MAQGYGSSFSVDLRGEKIVSFTVFSGQSCCTSKLPSQILFLLQLLKWFYPWNIHSDYLSLKDLKYGNSLAVQWLRLDPSTAGGCWFWSLVEDLRSHNKDLKCTLSVGNELTHKFFALGSKKNLPLSPSRNPPSGPPITVWPRLWA